MTEPANLIVLGILASLVAGLSTGVGALPIFLRRTYPERAIAAMLGFGAGVMLAATSFSLLMPALEAARVQQAHVLGALAVVGAGVLAGAACMFAAEKLLPHEHLYKGREGGDLIALKGTWLFVTAIAVHNFPEGLAVGVGFGGGDINNGLAITTGIALQNLPEGLVAALSLLAAQYSLRTAFGVAALTGAVETVGGFIGIAAVTLVAPLLPFALAFAGGAMLHVISQEIIPESHRFGFERSATGGVIVGFVLMMSLDSLFA